MRFLVVLHCGLSLSVNPIMLSSSPFWGAMTYVYVLRSTPTGRYYVGISSNPAKRLQQHNSGQTKSTKAYVPWEIVCAVPYDSREGAASVEYKLKSSKSRKVIEIYVAQSVESRRINDSLG